MKGMMMKISRRRRRAAILMMMMSKRLPRRIVHMGRKEWLCPPEVREQGNTGLELGCTHWSSWLRLMHRRS